MNLCPAARAALAQLVFESVEIEMRKNHFARAGEADAVDDAGVIGAVGKDDVVRPQNGAEQADVGGVSGTEIQRRFGAGELGQLRFQFFPDCGVAGEQPGTSRADGAARRQSLGHGLAQSRIDGEPEIIVRGKIQVRQDFQMTQLGVRFEGSQFRFQAPEQGASFRAWRMAEGPQAEIAEQLVVFVALGVGRREQLFADEDRIGSGEETERGGFARQGAAARAEAHHATRA